MKMVALSGEFMRLRLVTGQRKVKSRSPSRVRSAPDAAALRFDNGRVIASPRPVPWDFVVKNGLKT